MGGFDPLEMTRRAGKSLEEARDAMESADYPRCIARAQECVEMAIKTIFVILQGEYPKGHEISDELVKLIAKMPDWLIDELGRMKIASKALSQWKDLARYGDELLKLSPERLFRELDAKFALKFAEELDAHCFRLLVERQATR